MTFGFCVVIIEKLSAGKQLRLISESAAVQSGQFRLSRAIPPMRPNFVPLQKESPSVAD
jgi:hypothetical protein